MEARLTGIDRNEALLYLGYKGGPVPEEIREEIFRCEALLQDTARPRGTWRLFRRLPDGSLEGTAFRPEGNDIQDLLQGCDQVILMGATLGMEVEALLRKAQVRDMAQAVILDACASSAIENVCDNFCADIQAQIAPLYLTERFSPGYGDMPFAQQPDLCQVLDISRRIGVDLSPSGLMIPQKSVTAVMGVSPVPRPKRPKGCVACAMFETCHYRKDGQTCGKL